MNGGAQQGLHNLCTCVAAIHQLNSLSGLSSVTTNTDLLETMNISSTKTLIEMATSIRPFTDTLPTSIAMTASAPTAATSESPLQRHLALIIGLPTGIGLSIVGLSLCLIWIACSSYCEYRKSLPQQGNTGSAGTRLTNVQVSNTCEYIHYVM